MTYFYIVGFYYTTVFIVWQGENCFGNGRAGRREQEAGSRKQEAGRNGAVRKRGGEAEQAAGRGRKVARWDRRGGRERGGKLRGGAGRGGRERAAAVQITLAIFGGGW